MNKNNNNLNLIKNLIDSCQNDNELLNIITNNINILEKLDPIWNDSIEKILRINITKKFKKKIKNFYKKINNKNDLLILNLLLESYDVITDLNENIQEKTFYVILNELVLILNEQNISSHENYSKALKCLKKIRLLLID